MVIWCHVSCILYFLLIMSLFKIAPTCSADVLSSDLKYKKAVMSFGENALLAELCSGMSYSAVGCEFNVHESSIYFK